MMEGNQRSGKHYGLMAVCGLLVLAAVFGAYRMGAGSARSADVGQEAAKSAALNHAGVAESVLSRYEIAREERDGALVYEVNFMAEGMAYAYEISAADGSIVKFSREADSVPAPPPAEPEETVPAPAGSPVDEARAWEIAYSHAGVAAADAAPFPAKLDDDGGVSVYELEFLSGGYEYDYEISAADGSIVKFEKEPDDRSTSAAPASETPVPGTAVSTGGSAPQGGQSAGTKSEIGEPKAKEIALRHAGVSADSVSNYKWELDVDGIVSVYELGFLAGGYEYEYEINAADGSVVKFEKEAVQSAQGTLTADAVSYIGEARAREIAYAHACLTADDVTHCGVELDHHGSGHHGGHSSHHGSGCCIYEVGFQSGGYEYEYEIDAVTGEILGFEQEQHH